MRPIWALARLEAEFSGDVIVITQNVDDLHEQAGSRNILHMHGKLSGALCHACQHRWPAPPEMHPTDPCPACGKPRTRPDIVWFGETPYFMDEIARHLRTTTLFAAIGTSGQVYPAASFVQEATMSGAGAIELTLERSAVSDDFDESRLGTATQLVPEWVSEVLYS